METHSCLSFWRREPPAPPPHPWVSSPRIGPEISLWRRTRARGRARAHPDRRTHARTMRSCSKPPRAAHGDAGSPPHSAPRRSHTARALSPRRLHGARALAPAPAPPGSPARAPRWQRLADAALAPAREAPPRLRVRKRGRREGQETWVPLQALQLPQSPQRQDPHRPRREAAGATPGPASAPRTAPAARCRNPRAPGTVPSGRGLRIPLPARRRPGREAPGDLAPPARGIGCAQAGQGAPLGPGMRPGPRARAARP